MAEDVSQESLEVEFQEQCFLLSFMDVLIAEKQARERSDESKKKLPSADSNATLLLDGYPFGFVNKLTQYPNQRAFFNMENKDIAHLQPMIRLFKVIENEEGEETEQEITFDSHLTPDDMNHFLKNKSSRGYGAGIQSFSFAYEGQDPFAVKRSISAKLTIFANTFEELLRPRMAADGSEYKYIDLALKTGKGSSVDLSGKDNSQNADVVSENLDKLNFRLKAVVGWAIPKGNTESFGRSTEVDGVTKNDLLDAINDSYITLNLTPTLHEFKIDDYGRIQFILNYLAYTEGLFDHARFNIFSNPEVAANVVERQMQLKFWGDSCNADEINDLKEELQTKNQILADKNKSLQTLVENLLGEDEKTSKVWYVPFKSEGLAEFNSKGPYYEFEDSAIQDYVEEMGKQIESDIEGGLSDSGELSGREGFFKKTVGELEEETPIGFFFVSDLFDTILTGIEDSLKDGFVEALAKKDLGTVGGSLDAEKGKIAEFYIRFQKFRLLLGPVEIRQLKSTSSTKNMAVNLGDIPVSLKYFTEWLTKKMLKKDDIHYPLASFANDFFNEFIREFLNNDTCFDGTVKQKIKVGQATLTSYHDDPGTDEVTQAIGEYGSGVRLNVTTGDAPQPILNISGDRGNPVANPGPEFENDYLIYYAARVQPPELMVGDRMSDEDRGIFHYGIGKDRGLVKTINFTATGPPSLRAVRWEQQGYDGLQQLMSIYNAEIKSYANVNAFPGAYIFIEPRTISPNTEFDLTQFGLGGYHMITRSEHTFGIGEAGSNITARWVAPVYGGEELVSEPDEGEEDSVEEEDSEAPSKCFATMQEAAESGTEEGEEIVEKYAGADDTVGKEEP